MADHDMPNSKLIAIEAELDNVLIGLIDGIPDVTSRKAIVRRRIFSSAALILGGFAGVAYSLPIPNRQPIDSWLWLCLFIGVISIGIWQRRLAIYEARKSAQIRR